LTKRNLSKITCLVDLQARHGISSYTLPLTLLSPVPTLPNLSESSSTGHAADTAADTVVAIGASAGGLDALDRYFGALDSDLPAAFVVIQHLSPDHRTMMDALLARHTKMQVQVAQHDDSLRAGQVYVIPAGMMMTVVDRKLHLTKRPTQGLTHPINLFFESLAHAGCDRFIGIVLSGTGSDGSDGVRALADAGGWVLAQDPKSAAFDGMPRNALATGRVHDSGPPEDLARLTTAIIRDQRDPELIAVAPDPDTPIAEVLSKVSTIIAIDLSHYKPHTLIRRLERRVLATGRSSIAEYLDLLTQSMDESAALRREMMIPVTAFFRDIDAFDDLRQSVLAPAFAALKEKSAPVFRAWVVGCATGQEAYTLAILAQEEARKLDRDVEIKIFATDIEPSYLQTAAQGRYPARALDPMPDDLRRRYFDLVEGGEYQISPRLRRSIVFSQHDALSAPPFLNLDLVTCRNMLIYLRPQSQERVLKRLMFGLRAGAALFLGSSESPGSLTGLVETLSARNKIYRLKDRLRHLSSDDILGSMEPRDSHMLRNRTLRAPEPFGAASPAMSPAIATILDAFAPPSVVVDSRREIRHVYGDVTGVLQFRAGDASLDLAQVLPARTGAIVSTLLYSAARDPNAVKSVVLHAADDPDYAHATPVRISVRSVRTQAGTDGTGQLLVSFERLTLLTESPPPVATGDLAALSEGRATALEQELDRLRATLKATIEDLGSANEELQASNEELMASNEELQSTNEELQSVNEELHTVNAEFQHKIVQLNEAYADLESLSRAARIPLIFLDRNFCVTRYSAQATELFRLREQDLGRPLFDITHDLDLPDLAGQVTAARDTKDTQRIEVAGRDGRTWLVTIQPFVSQPVGSMDRDAARIVLSFIDVTSVRAMRHLQAVVDGLPQNVAVLDRNGLVTQVNEAWRLFALSNGGSNLLATGTGLNYLETLRMAATTDTDAHAVLHGLRGILDGTRPSFSLIYPCHAPEQERWFLMHASALREGGCVVTHLDISNFHPPAQEKGAT
jgi:two-component system, chemotaxis family, CheB/CheR fusion protein